MGRFLIVVLSNWVRSERFWGIFWGGGSQFHLVVNRVLTGCSLISWGSKKDAVFNFRWYCMTLASVSGCLGSPESSVEIKESPFSWILSSAAVRLLFWDPCLEVFFPISLNDQWSHIVIAVSRVQWNFPLGRMGRLSDVLYYLIQHYEVGPDVLCHSY